MPEPANSPKPPLRERIEDHFAEFERQHADRARAMDAEVREIVAGKFVPVQMDLDPLSAHHLATAVNLALTHPDMQPNTKEVLEKVFAGIAERLAPQFPELARQLFIGRHQRRNTEEGR